MWRHEETMKHASARLDRFVVHATQPHRQFTSWVLGFFQPVSTGVLQVVEGKVGVCR